MRFIILPLMGALFVFTMAAKANDEIKVCTNNTTYPPKVVVVCPTCQCPPGYY